MRKLKAIFCVMFGHSRIITECMGQITCARCGDVIGDALMGSFDADDKVLTQHACETCEANWPTLTWRDKFLAPSREAVFKDGIYAEETA